MSKRRCKTLCPSCCGPPVNFLCIASSWTTRVRFKPRCGVNLSCTGWRLSGDLPKRPGKTIPLTVTRPKKQRIETPEAAVRCSRGREFVVENILIKSQSMRGFSMT